MDIFNFGSLVDAMLSEEFRINPLTLTLRQDIGPDIVYASDIFLQADRLADRCKKDPVIAEILKRMIGQYIFIRSLGFTYEGEDLALRARCKFDAYGKALAMGADYKTTAAFYMDLARIEMFWIIGISKVTGEIFKHAIRRGDAVYLAGRAKYSFWAYRWKLLVEPFAEDPALKLVA